MAFVDHQWYGSMINHQLGQLYRYYKASGHKKIVTGGLVSERDYVRSAPRVVFVGKEISIRRTGWTLTQHIGERIADWSRGRGNWQPTWGLVGIWAYGISEGFPYWRVIANNKLACAACGLRTIGATNLHLGPGRPTSNSASILGHVLEPGRRRLLAKELDVMKPDLVLCGNTFWETLEALSLDLSKARPMIRGRPFHYSLANLNGKKIVFLDLYHPSRWGHQESYRCIKELVMKLRTEGVLR